jgi:hypothetical protein
MDHQGLSVKFVDVQGLINLMHGFGILEAASPLTNATGVS